MCQAEEEEKQLCHKRLARARAHECTILVRMHYIEHHIGAVASISFGSVRDRNKRSIFARLQ